MQSKENNKQEQEETPGEEQVTISLEEYSNMKKRLHELGGIGPSMQSRKGEESPREVPETPQGYLCFFWLVFSKTQFHLEYSIASFFDAELKPAKSYRAISSNVIATFVLPDINDVQPQSHATLIVELFFSILSFVNNHAVWIFFAKNKRMFLSATVNNIFKLSSGFKYIKCIS